MTIPLIHTNYKKKEYALRLQRFHNMIVSAMERAEDDFNIPHTRFCIGALTAKEAFKKYFADYIKYTKYEEIRNNIVTVYLEDGTWFQLHVMGSCNYYFISYDVNGSKGPNTDSKVDILTLHPNNIDTYTFSQWHTYNVYSYIPIDFMSYCAPYRIPGQDKLTLCKDYGDVYYSCCLKLIQENGWKYPSDYPYKI